jgi:hypothetical protein
MAIRLIIAAGQKRPEHPKRVIVAFERLGGMGHLLKTRAVIQRTKFCTDVLCVLQRRPQKPGQNTCVLRIVHEPSPHPVSFPYLTGVRRTQPNTSPGLWPADRSPPAKRVKVSELGFLLG